VTAVESLRVKSCILDGEVVALDEQGRHSFGLLQNFGTSKAPLRFYVFDLLHIDNEDLTRKPLEQRRRRLEREFDKLPKNR
jgi:bifunctional non-homologous end joining protein LigD